MSIDPIIGSVGFFAGNYVPQGWAPCDGRTLPITHNEALFSIIGSAWGGDGIKTFALPDLRRTGADGGHLPFQQGEDLIACIAITGVYPSRS